MKKTCSDGHNRIRGNIMWQLSLNDHPFPNAAFREKLKVYSKLVQLKWKSCFQTDEYLNLPRAGSET